MFRNVEAEIAARIRERAAAASDPCEAVLAGCVAFLDLALDDTLRRRARCRAIDSEFGLGTLKQGLAACAAAGPAPARNLDVLAHLLSGAVNEAVFAIAEAAERRRAHRHVVDVLTPVVRGMLGAALRSGG